MGTPYILAIIGGGIFVIVLVVFLITYFRERQHEHDRQAALDEMYADENLCKMEYDCAVYDEETEKIAGSLLNAKALNDELVAAEEGLFARIDTEGLEEITGNYTP